MKEAYVSFEVAKLLKEKGFNSPCQTIWYDNRIVLLAHLIDNNSLLLTDEYKFSIQKESLITIPTHQMACAWLREEKNIVIVIEPHAYDYPNEKTSSYVFSIWKGDNYIETYSNGKLRGISYLTYEDAVEAALKYTLENLI